MGPRNVLRHVSADLIMSEHMKKKMRQRDRAVVVPGNGDPCPRCGVPMQIREYSNSTNQYLRRPYFYTRWFCCLNNSCRTTMVMPERYKIMNPGVQWQLSDLIRLRRSPAARRVRFWNYLRPFAFKA